MFSVLILAVCGNTIVQFNASADTPSDQIACTSYNTCKQCTNETTCEWLFEKQSCVVLDLKFTSDLIKKSCPRFKVTAGNYNTKSDMKIKVISEGAESLKTLLGENEIKCQIGEESKHVTVENDNTISCNYSVPREFKQKCHRDQAVPRNPLFVEYFSIIIGGSVRLKFDEVRDHYLAVYPCSTLSNSTSCSVFSNCTAASWDDGPNQYYCNWCLENKKCMYSEQEGKCYARDTARGTWITVGDVVHVGGDDVRVESFDPSEGPVSGDTALTVKVRGHKVLGAVHETTTVTVAGRECRDPKTQADGETIACTVVAYERGAAVDDPTNRGHGPVVVTYRSAGRPAVELSSAGAEFTFTCKQEPTAEPGQTFDGIASGGTRSTVRGSFECARDPRLYVWFDGARKYGDTCTAAAAGNASAGDAAAGNATTANATVEALVCPAPALPEAATLAAHNVGLEWTFRGQIVQTDVPDGHYTPRPDPVFTDFQVDDRNDSHTVTIHGLNVEDVRPDDVTVLLLSGSADGDAGDECVVQWINSTSVACAVASTPGGGGRSAANTNALVIRVGRNLNQTVEQKRSDRPERPLSAGRPTVEISSAGAESGFPCTQETTADPGQWFEGIAFGGTRVTVRGSFECARDPRLYVRFDGTIKYGGACSAAGVRNAAATALVCPAPELPEAATGAAHNVGLVWTFRGRTVQTDVSGGHYAVRPDPVFTDFRVDGGRQNHPATVTVHGLNVDGVRRDDVTVRLLFGSEDGDPGDECVVQRIDRTSITCAAASTSGGGGGRSAADANSLLIAVGAKFVRWVYPAAAVEPDRDDGGSRTEGLQCPLLVCLVFACSAFLLTSSLCALYALRPGTATAKQPSDTPYAAELRGFVTRTDCESYY